MDVARGLLAEQQPDPGRRFFFIVCHRLLTLAIGFGHFKTEGDLKKLYTQLRKYGSSLVPYERTELHGEYAKWKAECSPATGN